MLSNTDLRNGTVFKDGGEIYTVLKYEHKFHGRGGSVVKVRVRNLRTGSVLEKSYKENDKVESADTHRTTVQFLYSDGINAVFMDTQSFEQFPVDLEKIGNDAKYLCDGLKVVTLFLDGEPVSVEVPKVIEMKIKETVPGVKGDTANNPTKKATLENSLEVDVPLFSKTGDQIKINTETGTYVSRA